MSETTDTDLVDRGGRILPRRIADALGFYARAEPALVAADGGAMARAALAEAHPSCVPPLLVAPAGDEARFTPVPMVYTNHAGLTQNRMIVPVALKFGSPWHPGEHILYGLDHAKSAYREFALSGIRAFGQGAVDERTELLVAMGRTMDLLAPIADFVPNVQAAYEMLADAGATSTAGAASC